MWSLPRAYLLSDENIPYNTVLVILLRKFSKYVKYAFVQKTIKYRIV